MFLSPWSKRLVLFVATALLASVVGGAARAQNTGRTIIAEPVNDCPGWMVRVSLSHPDHIYKLGEEVTVTVVSEKEGYLYLFNLDPEGNVSLLFPNNREKDNRIGAKQPRLIPGPGSGSVLKVTAPAGKEYMWAIVTTQPSADLANIPLGAQATGIPEETFRTMLVRVCTGQADARKGVPFKKVVEETRKKEPERFLTWAEHKVELISIPPNGKPPTGEQRVALVVGISEYSDPQIKQLFASHKDAANMDAVLRGPCRFDRVITLVNKDATLSRIRSEFSGIVSTTRPGDTVLIYWSGHGTRLSNLEGNPNAEMEACLVPHDGKFDDMRGSMLTDRTFGRMVQELDGRKVMVILDTCHSGGNIEGMKMAGRFDKARDGSPQLARGFNPPGLNPQAKWEKRHFLDFHVLRLKAIGQKDADVLAACTFKQFAWERQDREMGVMTYYIVERLKQGSGPVTLKDIADHVQKKVPAYVEPTGFPQDPVFSNETSPPKPVVRP